MGRMIWWFRLAIFILLGCSNKLETDTQVLEQRIDKMEIVFDFAF